MANAKGKETNVEEKLLEVIDKSQTYNPLMQALKTNDKKNLFVTNVNTAFIKTGFPLFDYYFGSVINVHDELGKIIRQDPRIGQAAGSFNLIVGGSGSGKTTFAVQLASNIIRQFKNSNVIHFDCEQRFDMSRAETISGLSSDYFTNGRYIIKSGMIGLDSIQETIIRLWSNKMKLKDELTVNASHVDEFGKPVTMLEPTVIIIDSITTVLSETVNAENNKEVTDAEKIRSNTDGARDAKTMRGLLKDVLPHCKEANIIIYGINHINSNMSMNAFLPPAKQQNYLKQDESIPGGKSMIYAPYSIIKLIAKPSDDFTEDADGFAGHIVLVEPIKSSSNQSGNNSKGVSFELVFRQKYGFDSLRSLILYGRDKGIIEGNKGRLKFKDNPEYTFSWKNVYNEVKEKPIWQDVKNFIIPKLDEQLSHVSIDELNSNSSVFDY